MSKLNGELLEATRQTILVYKKINRYARTEALDGDATETMTKTLLNYIDLQEGNINLSEFNDRETK